ncbi:MAG: hypothetical protein ACOYX1_13105 [Acidobacteriota bacterium]
MHSAAGASLDRQFDCARGEIVNRINEQFGLFAKRVSAETMRANPLRLDLAAAAGARAPGLRRRERGALCRPIV